MRITVLDLDASDGQATLNRRLAESIAPATAASSASASASSASRWHQANGAAELPAAYARCLYQLRQKQSPAAIQAEEQQRGGNGSAR